MDDDPCRSPRKPIPLGLLGMVGLITLLELGLLRGNLDLMDNVAVNWKYTGRVVRRKAKGNSILCFGDSMLKFGVLPRVVTEQTGEKTYGLALFSGSAPSSYFLLRRALDNGSQPKAIVVDFAREILGDGPASESRPYPWVELLKPKEVADLLWTARDPNLVASIGLRSVLHSIRLRHEIRSHIMARLNGTPTDQRVVTPALWRNWNTNDGGQANPKVAPFDDPVIPGTAPIGDGTWACHRVNERYLERFLELASSRGIQVYWTLTPVTPGTYSKWVHSGDEQLFDEFIRRQQERFPNIVVLDARESGFERTVFVDGVHLDRDGAALLSTGVAKALRASLDAPADQRDRWVKLPTVEIAENRLAIEDVGQSIAALRSLGAEKRR